MISVFIACSYLNDLLDAFTKMRRFLVAVSGEIPYSFKGNIMLKVKVSAILHFEVKQCVFVECPGEIWT